MITRTSHATLDICLRCKKYFENKLAIVRGETDHLYCAPCNRKSREEDVKLYRSKLVTVNHTGKTQLAIKRNKIAKNYA